MKVEMLFGGSTRFTILETLAEAKKSITAHQIAITRGLDPAATYRCLTEFVEFGIVKSETRQRNRTFYRLSSGPGRAAAKFMRSLKQKEPDDLEDWLSPKMQAKRMAKITRLDKSNESKIRDKVKTQNIDKLLSKRTPGELTALVISSKIGFGKLFEQKGNVFILNE